MQRYKKQPGIYILIIKAPNKIYKYVGQSIHINERLNQHKNSIKYNKHYNTYMQNAYNKYNNLEVKVNYCNKEFITVLEQTWINIIQCENNVVCLNQQAAERKTRFKLSSATKEKISKSLKSNPQKANKSHTKDKSHHNYIHTTYSFINIFNKEIFVGTRKDFMHKVNLHWNNCARLTDLIKGRTKVIRTWTLTNNLEKFSLEELQRAANKNKIYIFKKGSEEFLGTVTEFIKTYSLKKPCTHKHMLEKGINNWSARPLEE